MSRRALAVAVVAMVAVGCAKPVGGQVAGAPARPPRQVRLVAAAAAELPTKIAVSGVLAAQEELVLGLEAPGRVAELPVDVGDAVAAGAVVAKLAPRDFANAATSAGDPGSGAPKQLHGKASTEKPRASNSVCSSCSPA